MNLELPISKSQSDKAVSFLKSNFGEKIKQAVEGTPFTIDHICGIACQETAYVWAVKGKDGKDWIDKFDIKTMLERCVFDASGDIQGATRNAFPKNTQAFRAEYGNTFTNMLIAEANKTRAIRGFNAAQIVYKGYGIFQYDLQAVVRDRAFFEQKQWYNFDDCLKNCIGELKIKYALRKDIWASLKAYNGAGLRATNYANNVTQFTDWSKNIA